MYDKSVLISKVLVCRGVHYKKVNSLNNRLVGKMNSSTKCVIFKKLFPTCYFCFLSVNTPYDIHSMALLT